MSSICSKKNTLEKLPDELLLLICQYLSSTEVLYSFYGLNIRLFQMISGYFQHVVIAQTPYKLFTHICASILPEIGSNINSLVISNQWKGILSKSFLNYYDEQISSLFPNLKQLTFVSFSDHSLKFFLDRLKNLPDLHEITLCHTYQSLGNSMDSETLLHELFKANNNQLNSILFDDDSIVFSFEQKNDGLIYSNIQNLSIDLKTIHDLHQLLTLLPQLKSLNVAINKDLAEHEIIDENLPVVNLKYFQLQSFGPSWKLDNLSLILKRIPNVEELSIAIEANDDTKLIDGQHILPLICDLPLEQFNYYLRFYNSTALIDPEQILSSWEEFEQEFICFKTDDQKTLVLYTIPFVFSFLILPNSIAKNEVFSKNYAPHVKNLTLCDVASVTVDTLSIIKKCRQVQNLNLRNGDSMELPKKNDLCKLSCLTKVAALRDSCIHADYFQRLLEIAPNLYHLEANYEFLRPLLENESVCFLLKQRITHIYMLITTSTNLDLFISSIPHLASVFSSLKHFYICLDNISEPTEPLILTIFKYLSEWNSLVSLGIVGINLTEAISSKDPQQWVLQNSTLTDQRLFVVDYTDKIFRLWL